MIRSFIKTSLRFFLRNRGYVMVNLAGLSIGIAGAMLMLLWVQNEYSYDSIFPNHKNIYQLKKNSTFNGSVNTDDALCLPAYSALKSVNSKVKNVCFTGQTYGHTLTYEQKIFNKEGLAVSPEFLEMFKLPLISGSSASLNDPYSIMVNESTAREMFGNSDPIGKFVAWDNGPELKVTGVFKDLPRNSTFWYHALVPVAFYEKTEQWVTTTGNDWNHFWYLIYAELGPGVTESDINPLIRDMVKVNVKNELNQEVFLHPMDRWYLYDNFVNGKEAGGRIEYVRIFIWIAVLTLFISCVNYMNLSTAQSEKRKKEIELRRTLGSNSLQVAGQFLTEAFILTFISFLIAVVIVVLFLPTYNLLINKRIDLDIFSRTFLLNGSLIIVICAVLAGMYPALFYSGLLSPKKEVKSSSPQKNVRRGLVTVQYSFAVFLIIAMVIIFQQITHIKGRPLGYDQTNLVVVAYNDDINKNFNAIKSELLSSSKIQAVNRSDQAVYQDYSSDFVDWVGKQDNEEVSFVSVSASYDYTETMRIRMIEGRDFSEAFPTDSLAVLLNKAAVKFIGFKDPIGQQIRIGKRQLTVVGVVDDVVMGSPFEPVAPLVIKMGKDYYGYLNIRTTESTPEVLEYIADILKKHAPTYVAEIWFANEGMRDKMKAINLVGTMARLFAILTGVLTVIGVLAMAAFTAEQRSKEIAIRKILGAPVENVLMLLASYFVKIVIIASLISVPIAWFALNSYLQHYTYRIEISWWVILLIILLVIVVTVAIVVTQVLKVATSNPATKLKGRTWNI